MVIFILLLTFLGVKAASPTLPGDNQAGCKCATKWFGEIFCVIIFSFISFATILFDPHDFFVPFLFDFTLRVGFPMYYIHSLPSLSQFMINHFNKNVISPIIDLKEHVDQVLRAITSRTSPEIDVNV